MGFLQDVNDRYVEIERDLRNVRETIAVSDSEQETLNDKVSSLKKELSSIRVGRANLTVDIDDMTALV